MENDSELFKITPRLSYEERKKFEELLKKETSWSSVVREMGRSRDCLRLERKRCPEGLYNALEAQQHYEKKKYQIRAAQKKAFTQEEDQLIKKRMEEGAPIESIRSELRCSTGRLKKWIMKNNPKYKAGHYLRLSDRISALEELVKTLIDVYGEDKK